MGELYLACKDDLAEGGMSVCHQALLTDLTSIVGLMFPKIQSHQSRLSLLVERQEDASTL
jgi:hypothetical protein